MKKIYSHIHSSHGILPILLLSLCIHLCLNGCARRPLEDEMSSTALVPFNIDWSKSGLVQADIRRASIWFFPHDGTPAFEWRMEDDITKATVPLAAGKYSMVLFNETIDETDWQRIGFEGQDKYETFNVYALTDNFKGLYSRADDADVDVRKSPEAISSWSMDEFEVTIDLIAYTRGVKSKNVDTEEEVKKMMAAVPTITPKPLTASMFVKAHVKNLTSALRSSAALEGATGKISLATGRPILGGITHVFIMNNRKYDIDNPLNGTIEAHVLVFKFVEEDVKFKLQLDFKLQDGTDTPPEIFDITDQIDKEAVDVKVEIGLAVTDTEEDRPIILPKVNVGSDVGVDEWDDVSIPIH